MSALKEQKLPKVNTNSNFTRRRQQEANDSRQHKELKSSCVLGAFSKLHRRVRTPWVEWQGIFVQTKNWKHKNKNAHNSPNLRCFLKISFFFAYFLFFNFNKLKRYGSISSRELIVLLCNKNWKQFEGIFLSHFQNFASFEVVRRRRRFAGNFRGRGWKWKSSWTHFFFSVLSFCCDELCRKFLFLLMTAPWKGEKIVFILHWSYDGCWCERFFLYSLEILSIYSTMIWKKVDGSSVQSAVADAFVLFLNLYDIWCFHAYSLSFILIPRCPSSFHISSTFFLLDIRRNISSIMFREFQSLSFVSFCFHSEQIRNEKWSGTGIFLLLKIFSSTLDFRWTSLYCM